MAKVNLSLASDRLFGKYLPAVFIKRIIIDYPRAEDGAAIYGKTGFSIDLSINFTKDSKSSGEHSLEEMKSWMTANLGGLYLYTFLSPDRGTNELLKRKSLNLKRIFNFVKAPTVRNFTTEHYLYDLIESRMLDQWYNKDINFFDYEYSGGYGPASIPTELAIDDFSTPAPGVGLARFYYEKNPTSIYKSTEIDGSLFNILFYGNNRTGPWFGGTSDLPEFISYIDPPDPYYGSIFSPSMTSTTGNWSTTLVPEGLSFFKKNLANFLSELSDEDLSRSMSMYKKLRLIDLLEPGDLDPGKLIFREVFDQDGNEIIQITDLNVRFEYDGTTGTSLDSISELMFISTIGLDVDEGTGLQMEKGVGLEDAPSAMFNNYFGPITYETVLKNNRIDESLTEIFVDSEGIPYDETPLQALNGRYYAEGAITRSSIASALSAITEKYIAKYPTDRNLNENISNLQYMASVYGATTSFFREFKRFQKTYPLKSQRTPSGKMYSEVVNVMTQASKRMTLEKQLFKKLILNSLVVDLRATKFISEDYVQPNPSLGLERGSMEDFEIEVPIIDGSSTTTTITLPDGTVVTAEYGYEGEITGYRTVTVTGMYDGFEAAVVSDEYIPRNWIQFSRTTKTAGTKVGPYTTTTDKSELLTSLRYASGVDPDATEGFGMIVDAALEEGVDDAYFDDADRSLISDIYGAREPDSNLVCRNMGYWFFDWEKALHQQSMMAHVVKLSALQRFLGLGVPYKYFKIVGARMIRRELPIARTADGTSAIVAEPSELSDITLGTKRRHYAVQTMEVHPASDFPRTLSSFYGGFSDAGITITPAMLETGELDPVGEAGEILGPLTSDFIEKYGIGYPEVELLLDPELAEDRTTTSVNSKSEFKIVNFDVVGSSRNYRLEGYGRFTPYGEDMALQKGLKVRDGYRLVTFAFKDYMDDDLAYYNTNYGEDDARNEVLAEFNHHGDPTSEYTMVVLISDKTLEFLVKNIYGLLLNTYNNLKEYVEFAEEVCSFNNITNQFNQFFVDAINDRYPTNQDKPWIRAAFVINSMREVFFSDFADDNNGQEEAILTAAVDMINKVSPERGNLGNLRAFLQDYRRFIMFFDPLNDDAEVPVANIPTPFFYNRLLELTGYDEDATAGTPITLNDLGRHYKTIEFVNSFSIDTPIYGDMNLNTYKAGEAEDASDIILKYPRLYFPLDIGTDAGYSYVRAAAESGEGRFNYYHIRNAMIKNGTGGGTLMDSTVYRTIDKTVNRVPSGTKRRIYLQALLMRIAAHTHYGGVAPAAKVSTEFFGVFDYGYDSLVDLGNEFNRPGVNAQSLLYVITNQIKPKLDICDEIYHALNHHYMNVVEGASDFILGDGFEGLQSRFEDRADSSGYQAFDAVTGGYNRTAVYGMSRIPVQQERQYEEFRYAIATLTNALIDVIKPFADTARVRVTSDYEDFEDNHGFDIPGYTHGESYYNVQNVILNLLDKNDPIGPDYLGVFNDGEVNYELLDSMRDENVYGSSSWYQYYEPGSDGLLSIVTYLDYE